MTDFIMEQELSLAPEPQLPEKTDEELSVEIVESFMNMSAAFSNAECIFECVKIAEFCREYDIQIPETAKIITEDFKEFAAKVGDVIATVIDWIRSLISGLCNIFTKARLRAVIAKIKNINWAKVDVATADTVRESMFQVALIGGITFAAVEVFSYIIDAIVNADNPQHAKLVEHKTEDIAQFFQTLAAILSIMTKPSNIITYTRNANKCADQFLGLIQASLGNAEAEGVSWKITKILMNISKIAKELSNVKEEDLVKKTYLFDTCATYSNGIISILTLMIEIDIPHSGAGILKSLNFDKTKIEELKSKGTIDDKAVLAIRKCARILAKAYDRVSAGVSFMLNAQLFVNDVNVNSDNKEKYKTDINNLKSRTNSKNIKEPFNKIDSEYTKQLAANVKEKSAKIRQAVE